MSQESKTTKGKSMKKGQKHSEKSKKLMAERRTEFGERTRKHRDRKQPPIDNKFVADGCERFNSELETALSTDIVRLIIAAREVLDIGHMAPEFDELDKAVEAFSERVPYENEN